MVLRVMHPPEVGRSEARRRNKRAVVPHLLIIQPLGPQRCLNLETPTASPGPLTRSLGNDPGSFMLVPRRGDRYRRFKRFRPESPLSAATDSSAVESIGPWRATVRSSHAGDSRDWPDQHRWKAERALVGGGCSIGRFHSELPKGWGEAK